MRKIDVLWLFEHIARELDTACIVRAYAKEWHAVDIAIHHVYFDLEYVFRMYEPRVVFLPFCYSMTDYPLNECKKRWPHAVYVNLAWEEIFYAAQKKIKVPGGTYAKRHVLHHAWGLFYKQFLMEHGVSEKNIFVNGNPALQLYRQPYCRYYKTKQMLAAEQGLDPVRRWVLIPENHRWAFYSDTQLRNIAFSRDISFEELALMRTSCCESLRLLLKWSTAAAGASSCEIVFRPKPATSLETVESFFRESGCILSPRFHILKHGSIREWILASNVVISSFSTTMIDAAVAKKPVYLCEPIPMLGSFESDWHQYVPRITTEQAFIEVCLNAGTSAAAGVSHVQQPSIPLQQWAEEQMLRTDPLVGLAHYVSTVVTRARRKTCHFRAAATTEYIQIAKFDITAHEKDFITDAEIDERTQAWTRIVLPQTCTRGGLRSTRHLQELRVQRKQIAALKKWLAQEVPDAVIRSEIFADIASRLHNPYSIIFLARKRRAEGNSYWNVYIAYVLACLKKQRTNKIAADYVSAFLLHEIGNPVEAGKCFARLTECVQLSPRIRADVYYQAYQHCIHAKRAEAGEYYDRYITTVCAFPRKSWTAVEQYRIASWYKSNGNRTKARQLFAVLLKTTNDMQLLPGIYFHLGELAITQGDTTKAEHFFKQCITLNPQHQEAHARYTALSGSVL